MPQTIEVDFYIISKLKQKILLRYIVGEVAN